MTKKELIRTDKNGTKYFHCSDRCCKCGGTGIIEMYIPVNGGECFDCGGSGVVEWEEKEYTPEHEAKLAADREKRAAKKLEEARKHATEKNAEFFSKNGFNAEGKTYFVLGKTYEIKEELKEQGAKWDNISSHWHLPNPIDTRECLEVPVEDMYDSDAAGVYQWNYWVRCEWDDPDYYVNRIQAKEDSLKVQQSTSKHVGQVGDKIEKRLKYTHTASWETGYGGYWNASITNLHTFKDEDGNIYIWKTDKFIESDYGTWLVVKGTIKDHSEYKGIKQTVLTRCRITD